MTRIGSVKRLLATDLDGTFIGNDQAMHELWAELDEAGITVAFATGRHLSSIEDFYRGSGVRRRASICITMVGTEIFFHVDGSYVRESGWSEIIEAGWDKHRVEEVVESHDDVTRQPDEWQSSLKSSYFVSSAASAAEVEAALRAEGLQAKLVFSGDRYLDLLPPQAGKGAAVSYVAEQLGLDPFDVVTAGDTGNDIDMMRDELAFRSIAVGNATDELRAAVSVSTFQATTDHAAGIREGLVAFGWLS